MMCPGGGGGGVGGGGGGGGGGREDEEIRMKEDVVGQHYINIKRSSLHSLPLNNNNITT
jgi:hypothetical protein